MLGRVKTDFDQLAISIYQMNENIINETLLNQISLLLNDLLKDDSKDIVRY